MCASMANRPPHSHKHTYTHSDVHAGLEARAYVRTCVRMCSCLRLSVCLFVQSNRPTLTHSHTHIHTRDDAHVGLEARARTQLLLLNKSTSKMQSNLTSFAKDQIQRCTYVCVAVCVAVSVAVSVAVVVEVCVAVCVAVSVYWTCNTLSPLLPKNSCRSTHMCVLQCVLQ